MHALAYPNFISTNLVKKKTKNKQIYLQAEYSTAKQHHKRSKNSDANFITISITIVAAL